MITIQNFEKNIDKTILQQGRSYFDNGKVINLKEDDDNIWTAEVKTSDSHQVEVELSLKGKVNDCDCDCSDHQDVCKHIVAVLFAIQDEKNANRSKPANAKSRNPFETLLRSLSIEECQQFIKTYASRNRKFKTDFHLFFSDKITGEDTESKYRDLANRIIKKYEDNGIIYYKESNALAREIKKLTETGIQKLNKNNYVDAFKLVKAILLPVTEAMIDADDSGGSIADSIDGIIDLLFKISESAEAVSLNEEIFDFVKNEINNPLYFAYADLGDDLTELLKSLALKLGRQDELIGYLDEKIKEQAMEDRSYRREFFQQAKIDVLKQSGRESEAEQLIEQHLDIVELRQHEVEKAINTKDYPKAKKLINDGIQIALNLKHPGTVKDWEEQLLRIALLENDIPLVRKMAKPRAFGNWFSVQHYRLWKSTFTPEEWQKEIAAHIDQAIEKLTKRRQASKHFVRQSLGSEILWELAPVLVEEGHWEKILELVAEEEDLERVMQFHAELSIRFPAKMFAIYIPLIRKVADQADTRGSYSKIANAMKKIMGDIPPHADNIRKLAEELRQKYSTHPRRPAMVEELEKIVSAKIRVMDTKAAGGQ